MTAEDRLAANDAIRNEWHKTRTFERLLAGWASFVETLERGGLPEHYNTDDFTNELTVRGVLKLGFLACSEEGRAKLKHLLDQLDERYKAATVPGHLKSSLLVIEDPEFDWMKDLVPRKMGEELRETLRAYPFLMGSP
jgi:hypothetical protein